MKASRKYSLMALVLAGSLLFGVAPRAQEATQPAELRLNVLVLDKKGQPVAGLRREDFQVFEWDQPQTISFFTKEDVPLSYGLVFDSSGSLRPQFPKIKEAVKLILAAARPADEGFLVRFISSDKIDLAHDFTTDRGALLDRVNSFNTEGGQTALIDALFYAASYLARHKSDEGGADRRRVLILISDGEDRNSQKRQEELVKLLRKSDIQIFSIGVVSELDTEGGLIRESPRVKAAALLEGLAKETGGRAFIVESVPEIEGAALELARQLHSQYVIGYNPAVKPGTGPYRKIRVKLVDAPKRDKLKVIARVGYDAP
ncbi:MAG TPA: VWA domain-containing protein [Pyrinomonadaceae bacterium]|nr:VWA domain-containing protein [Pyrinomonadaceae bacterium]